MFIKPTVFVLGAGTGVHYGYPLGKALIQDIMVDMINDLIFLPKSIVPDEIIKARSRDGNTTLFKGQIVFKEGLEKLDTLENLEKNPVFAPINDKFITCKNSGEMFVAVYIIELDQFNEFYEELSHSDSISIDSFLRDHPEYSDIGRTMIVYTLLKKENINQFKLQLDIKGIANAELNKLQDNWISFLLNELMSGLDKPEDFLNNAFHILTFNYSMEIEYSLITRLRKIKKFNESSNLLEKVIEKIKQSIIHVNGYLYEITDIANYGKYSSFGVVVTESSTQRFAHAYSLKENVKLIPHQRQDSNEVKTIIQNAAEIIVIGFSFDKDNLKSLGLEGGVSRLASILSNTHLLYLDYESKLLNLEQQLEKIAAVNRGFRFQYTRATGKSISEAYQNVFKVRLTD